MRFNAYVAKCNCYKFLRFLKCGKDERAQDSIGAGKDDHVRRFLTATDTRFGRFAFGVYAGGRRRLFLNLIFTGAIAAPARLDEIARFHAL